MEATRTQLADGMYLTYLPAGKFKTSLLSAQFVTPLRRETAAAYAPGAGGTAAGHRQLPGYGGAECPAGQAVWRPYQLYGPQKGENQCVGFVASPIDDSLCPGGEKLLEPVAELLGELICDPATERDGLCPPILESEKTNLIDAIRSIINDKREYADGRLLREMCAGEALRHSEAGRREGCRKTEPAEALRPVR